ncbi:MAG: hypothetical protein LBU36_00470 [Clostridiales bacterium]|jgi:hypothetical protein|nr:hypothetical protein [Clostridiales bacterium]
MLNTDKIRILDEKIAAKKKQVESKGESLKKNQETVNRLRSELSNLEKERLLAVYADMDALMSDNRITIADVEKAVEEALSKGLIKPKTEQKTEGVTNNAAFDS